MQCTYHFDREAIGTCCYCGKPFCPDCMTVINGRSYCQEHTIYAQQPEMQPDYQQPPQQPDYQDRPQTPPYYDNPPYQQQPRRQPPAYRPYQAPDEMVTYSSYKNRTAALVLCLILGVFGGHQFYTGKTGWGILYLFTGGLFGIGVLVDFIRILTGSFSDKYDLPLLYW